MNTNTGYKAIETLDELKKLALELNSSTEYGFDTETTGLDIPNVHLLGVSISLYEGSGYWIPVNKKEITDMYQIGLWDKEGLDLDQILYYLHPSLINPKIIKYIHNIKFDVPMMAKYNIHIKGYFDTMLASWVLGNQKGRKWGLKDLAREKFDFEMLKFEQVTKKYGGFTNTPIDLQTAYAGPDSDITLRLGKLTRPLLEKYTRLYETFLMEMDLALVLYENEKTGIRVNKQKLEQESTELDTEIIAAEKEFKSLVGDINPASPTQILNLLKNEVKQNHLQDTSETFLETMAVEHNLTWVKPLLKYRELAKVKSTFVDGIYNRIRSDGRIETNFRQVGIATGRLSSVNPNMQNLPKDRRSVFIASPDHYIVAIDFNGMELRILAHLAQEPALLDAFRTGKDAHSITTSLMFNIPYEDIVANKNGEKKKYRNPAKIIGFSIVYGATKYLIAERLETDVENAEKLINKFFDVYQGVKGFMAKTHKFLKRTGYVENVFGRRRYFPIKENIARRNVISSFEREAGNYPIQSLNAEITKRALIKCHRMLIDGGYKTKQISSIHDEIIWDVHKDEMSELVPKFVNTMETIYTMSVPIIAEVGLGHDMAEACKDEINWKLYLAGEWR